MDDEQYESYRLTTREEKKQQQSVCSEQFKNENKKKYQLYQIEYPSREDFQKWCQIVCKAVFYGVIMIVLIGVLKTFVFHDQTNKQQFASQQQLTQQISIYRSSRKSNLFKNDHEKNKAILSINKQQNPDSHQESVDSNLLKQSDSSKIELNVSSTLDYDITNSFNLWDISPQQKVNIFKRYKSLPYNQKTLQGSNFMDINYGKDQQFEAHAKSFQDSMQIIDWNSIRLSIKQKSALQVEFTSKLTQRANQIQKLTEKYGIQSSGKSGYIIQRKKITYSQFLNNLEYLKLTAAKFERHQQLKNIYEKERDYYNKLYQTNNYKKQIHACIVTPTFNNSNNYRYAWNLQSILQQEYSNYRLIIIDDASSDKTSQKIAKHLKWRGVSKEKVVLIKNKKRKTAMENIYYAIHKYCSYNQILLIADGDDELIGTQTLRLYNALYQSKKVYTLYSSHYYYDPQNIENPLRVGLSQDYPEEVKKNSSYRNAYHSYSHLRSMLSDLFLLERSTSLKDKDGKFYWTISDNAMYFPVLEMSCGRVEYIPELTYWYNANTGINDRLTSNITEYEQVKQHISDVQKHYHCINHIFQNITQTLQPKTKHL